MAKTIAPLLPATKELLSQLGGRLRLSRLRRRLTAKQVAERAGMAPMTLRSLERGGAGVTMGAYLAVMQVLGLERDLDLVAAADPVGRELQDAHLPARGRASLRAEALVPAGSSERASPASAAATGLRPAQIKEPLEPGEATRRWRERSGFASPESLMELLATRGSRPKKGR